jgi:sulfoxide reductase heme-binding subunit YedZ
MRVWLGRNWHWIITNLAGVGILTVLWLQFGFDIGVGLIADGSSLYEIDPFFEQTGRWSIRFLLICLAMTPLHRIAGWRQGLKLRKPVGLWAFAFAAIHYADLTNLHPFHLGWVGSPKTAYYYYLGAAALIILTLMALTSTQWAQRLLKKWWKRLHRLVYIAALLGFTHGLIAATTTKRAFLRDDVYAHEMQLYLVILIVLLCLRIPVIQNGLRKIVRWSGQSGGISATTSKSQ